MYITCFKKDDICFTYTYTYREKFSDHDATFQVRFEDEESDFVADWEILKTFFHHYNMIPNWVYDYAGHFDQETGSWTGLLGQVTKALPLHCEMVTFDVICLQLERHEADLGKS